jgi:MFS family permease
MNKFNCSGPSAHSLQRPSKLRDNRFYPWIVVLMSALFLLYKYVVQVSPSVMAGDLMRHFHIGATGLGNLAACYFYTYLVMQLFAGPLLDRYSPRILSTLALLLLSASMFGFSHAHALWQAFLWRAMMGVGAAFATVSYLKLAGTWFSDRQYSLVAGLLATAASLGAIIGQAPLAFSVEHSGWQHTLYLCALLGVAVALVYAVFVSDTSSCQQAENKDHSAVNLNALLPLLKSKKTWLLTLYSGLAWSPMAVFGGLWGDSFLQTAYHLDRTNAASLVSLSFVGLAVGGPFFGWLATMLNKKHPVMLCGLLLSLLALLYVLFSPLASIALLGTALFLFGAGTAAFMLGFALGKQWFCATLAATLICVVNTGDALFGAVSEPLVGKLLDYFGNGKMVAGTPVFSLSSYHLSMAVLPLYLFAAVLVLHMLRKYNED